MSRCNYKIWLIVPTVVLVVAGILGVRTWRTWQVRRIVDDFANRGVEIQEIVDGALVIVANRSVRLSEKDFELWSRVGEVAIADLSGCDVSHNALRTFLNRRTHPLCLRLARSSIGDDALEFSASIRRPVAYLDLAETRLTVAGLKNLRRPRMEYLSLKRTSVGDEVGSFFSEHVSLEGTPGGPYVMGPSVLDLTKTKITDELLKSIRWNPHGLVLRDTALTDFAFDRMSADDFDELVYLDLTNTLITDASLSKLAELERLRVIRLQGTKMTDAGLSQFTKSVPRVCIIDECPNDVTARHRLVDAMCHGQLFGRVSDVIWEDLSNFREHDQTDELIVIGVADIAEEGHVVLFVRLEPRTRTVLLAGFAVPTW